MWILDANICSLFSRDGSKRYYRSGVQKQVKYSMFSIRLADLAQQLNAQLHGDGDITIAGLKLNRKLSKMVNKLPFFPIVAIS